MPRPSTWGRLLQESTGYDATAPTGGPAGASFDVRRRVIDPPASASYVRCDYAADRRSDGRRLPRPSTRSACRGTRPFSIFHQLDRVVRTPSSEQVEARSTGTASTFGAPMPSGWVPCAKHSARSPGIRAKVPASFRPRHPGRRARAAAGRVTSGAWTEKTGFYRLNFTSGVADTQRVGVTRLRRDVFSLRPP